MGLIRYKEQVIINLDNVTFIKRDEVAQPDGKCAIRFHSVDGFEKHWEFDSIEEAKIVEKIILVKTDAIMVG